MKDTCIYIYVGTEARMTTNHISEIYIHIYIYMCICTYVYRYLYIYVYICIQVKTEETNDKQIM